MYLVFSSLELAHLCYLLTIIEGLKYAGHWTSHVIQTLKVQNAKMRRKQLKTFKAMSFLLLTVEEQNPKSSSLSLFKDSY